MKRLLNCLLGIKRILVFIIFVIITIGVSGQVNYSGTTLSGLSPSAIGINTKAMGNATFASGFGSQATAYYTTSIGFYSFASYTKAISLGSMVKSNRDKSIILGSGGSHSSGIYLENNIERSLMIGFGSQYPTFFVSESSDQPGVYDKTGKIAIGNVYAMPNGPQAKLHLLADEGEAAAIFIQPHSWENNESATLLLGSLGSNITANKAEGMKFYSENNYIFNNGFVGINTYNPPEYNLHVNGSTFTKTFRLYDDTRPPEEGYVLFSDDLGNAYWRDPTEYALWTQNNEGHIYRMGKVGINTQTPRTKLDVGGNISLENAIIGTIVSGRANWYDPDFLTILGSTNENASKIMIPNGNSPEHSSIKIINPINDIQFSTGGHISTVIRTNEFVIGNGNTPMALKVNGKIWAHEIEIKHVDWWDEVFEEDYDLMTLNNLEQYILNHKHLPDIPSEEQVERNGMDVGEINGLLLKKVEELTFYLIEISKEVEEMRKKIDHE